MPNGQITEGHRIFSWPDAMADNFFVKQFIETGKFVKEEPYNVILEDIIHPRSTNVVNHDIVPSGFLGFFIIYGWVGKLVGSNLIVYLTPFLAAVGLWFFYGLVREIINKRAGLISVFLLATFASYWYYANLVMLNTVAFSVLLLIGLYLLVKQQNQISVRQQLFLMTLAGFFTALSLSIRYLEIVWVAIMIIVIWFANFKKVRPVQIFFFILGALIPFGLVLFYNYQTYGELFTVGYLKMGDQTAGVISRLPSEFELSGISNWQSYLKFIFMPFGFHPRLIWHNFNNYIVQLYWPYLILVGSGVVLWIFNLIKGEIKKQQVVYAISASLATVYLLVYYGSWLFVDNLVLVNNTIASSYTRYWLPVMIMILPIIAYLLDKMCLIKINIYLKYTLVALILFFLSFYSYDIVMLTKGDGLIEQRKVIGAYYNQYKVVSDIVEKDAIIITDRADKVFFPEKRVIMFDFNYSIFPVINKIADEADFYYFTMLLDNDINFINEKKINDFNLKLENPVIIDEKFRLFHLTKIGED